MSLFKNYFFYNLLEKYTLVFGDLFSDIQVQKIGENGDVISTITVPVNYAEKEKWAQRQLDDSDLSRKPAIVLPRISYQYTDINYDGNRKLARNEHFGIVRTDETKNLAKKVYTPTPYIINYEVDIIAKTLNELNQIVEQIIPAFVPDIVISVKAIDDIIFDMPISYQGIFFSDSFDGSFDERRQVQATLNFSAKTYFFAPINKRNIILDVNASIFEIPVDNNLKKSFLIEHYNFKAEDFPNLHKDITNG